MRRFDIRGRRRLFGGAFRKVYWRKDLLFRLDQRGRELKARWERGVEVDENPSGWMTIYVKLIPSLGNREREGERLIGPVKTSVWSFQDCVSLWLVEATSCPQISQEDSYM